MLSNKQGNLWRGVVVAAFTTLSACTGMSAFEQAPTQSLMNQASEEEDVSLQAAPGCDSDSENFAQYSAAGWNSLARYPNNKQLVIVGSDPQAFRFKVWSTPTREDIDKDKWIEAVAPVLRAIRAERQSVNYYVPFIINGDMTEYGHGGERRTTRDVLKANLPGGVPGPLILPGLGNHDYDGNVGNCGNNGCARDATCDHITWTQAIQPKNSFDYQYVSGDRHQGSLSYSVTVGRVHIVQLNLEPTYTRSFETGGGLTGKPKRYFEITSSMDWLERDLRASAARGEQIIVNLHKRGQWQNDAVRSGKFSELVNQYGVAAIFAGHYHNSLGRVGSVGNVPVFQSGGLLAQSYLRLEFDWSNMKLQVQPIIYNRSSIAPVAVNLPSRVPADQAKITLYEHEEFQGRTCSFNIRKGEAHSLSSTACASLVGEVSSAKVENFLPGDNVCFRASNALRCVKGQYRGAFSLWTFNGRPALPNGLSLEVSGGNMNDRVSSVSRNIDNTSGYEVTLYEAYHFGGASCTVRLPSDTFLASVDEACGAGWAAKVSSAKVPNLPAWHNLTFSGSRYAVDAWTYRAYTYYGGLDVPMFAGQPQPPEGLQLDRFGGSLNDNVHYLSLTPIR